MKDVLVTGGSGFIGGHLVKELVRQGLHVRCFARPSSQTKELEALGVEIVRGSLLDEADLRRGVEGVDTVFHLAALTHALDVDELRDINTAACGKLADACLASAAPPTVVLVSSLAAAGPTLRDGEPIRERRAPDPVSNYGRTKRGGEIELQKRANDLPCTVVRPGVVFGPRDPGIRPMLDSIYTSRIHFVIGFRTPAISLIYVDDLVQLLIAAATRGERLRAQPNGEFSAEGYYFAADDSEYPTYAQFGRRMGKALNRSVFIWPFWRWVGRIVAGTAQTMSRLRGRSSIVNIDKVREAGAANWSCSAEKARQQLQWRPRQNLSEAMQLTANWYLESRNV